MPRHLFSLFFAITVVALLGCSSSVDGTRSKKAPTSSNTPKTPPVNSASVLRGQRGGRLVLLKPENLHAEILYDKTNKSIYVFLDTMLPTEVEKVRFVAKAGNAQAEEFPLKKEGAWWESADKTLFAKLSEGRSAKVLLQVDSKKGVLATHEYLTLE
jgi:hypothetical protein